MPFKEATLVTSIRAAVKRNYPRAYCRKISDRHTRGVPDLIVVFPLAKEYVGTRPWTGYTATLFVETKTLTGRTTAIQDAEQFEIEKAGGVVVVARSVQAVLDKMQDMGAQP